MGKQQYIYNLHSKFDGKVKKALSFLDTMLSAPNVLDEDRLGLEKVKLQLHSKEALDIEKTLAKGEVTKDTFDKMKKFEKDIADMALEHACKKLEVKEAWRKLLHSQIEQDIDFDESCLEGLL